MANYITNLPDVLIEIIYNLKDDMEFNDNVESYQKRMKKAYGVYCKAVDGYEDYYTDYIDECEIEEDEDPTWDTDDMEQICLTHIQSATHPNLYDKYWFNTWVLKNAMDEAIDKAWSFNADTHNSYNDILNAHERHNILPSCKTFIRIHWFAGKTIVKHNEDGLYGCFPRCGDVNAKNVKKALKKCWVAKMEFEKMEV